LPPATIGSTFCGNNPAAQFRDLPVDSAAAGSLTSSEYPDAFRTSFPAIAAAYFEAANGLNVGGVVFWESNLRKRFRNGRAICSKAMILALAGRRVSITMRRQTQSGDERDVDAPLLVSYSRGGNCSLQLR
jgi:hypothetical protein